MATTLIDVAELVRTHERGLWRFLRLLGAPADAAEDLMQEVFLEIVRRPFEDRGERAAAAYLRRVARHRFLMWLRARRARPEATPIDELDEQEAEAIFDEQAADGGDDAVEALRGCVDRLAERARRGIELRFRENRSRAEIAAALAVSEEGAKTLLRRAKEALLDCLRARLPR